MRGLRTQEGEKFERFFTLVQKEALKQKGIFFLDCGEGNDFDNGFMEGENLSGWLIPFGLADEFEKEYLKHNDDLEEWEEYFCWIEWENENSPKITIYGVD